MIASPMIADLSKLRRLQMAIRPMMLGRPYHNVSHVEACLAALNRYRDLAEKPDTIELAIWLHDAIYDPKRDDNEAKSAELAEALLHELEYAAETVAAVRNLILATRHDGDPGFQDGRLIADIDLLILSAPPADFDRYEEQVRQEYQHVPLIAFARGRAAVLVRFLQRDAIFYILREHELQAKQNLQRAVDRWKRM